ncbi:hypothetical protein JW960_17880 [candidate division KSB1 bacterium]|nr:hypothetical protein [candidate division KSB1 bacterium]
MQRYLYTYALLILALLFTVTSTAFPRSVVPTPREFFGFQPGTDRMLFDYERLIAYLQELDTISPRLKMEQIGTTPLGKPMYVACLSSEENIKRLDELKTINRRLALEATLSSTERETLIKKGRVFALGTLSMHATEVGPSQAAATIAYELVTTTDSQRVHQLENVVYMMVPSHNPDGMDMVVNHYNRFKDTKWDGCSMPGVYHKYIGHDNNRDFVTLSQEDTKAISRLTSTDWFPQVMVEKHQMGSGTARYFVPPAHDPIAENIDAIIWNWTGIFGANMIKDMTDKRLAGISQRYIFDEYWPGGSTTCLWKNVIGFLTEAAGVHIASPIYVESNELSGYGKGLAEYKKSINMPLPWEGGWWRLSDIVTYEIESTYSILKTAANHRHDILRTRNDLCRNEVEKGKTQAPYYYIIPAQQHDPGEAINLALLLQEHGIRIYQLTNPIRISNTQYQAGDIVIPLSQPFRPFLKEVMEQQHYPVRHYTPNGEIIKPYDITSWSLPLHRGVRADEINIRSESMEQQLNEFTKVGLSGTNLNEQCPIAVFSSNNNSSYKAAFTMLNMGLEIMVAEQSFSNDGDSIPAGSFLVKIESDKLSENNLNPTMCLASEPNVPQRLLHMPRIALIESYFHDMDAGWTRFIFDSYSIPYNIIRPGDFKTTNFDKRFDVIVFPNEDNDILMSGKYKSEDNTYSVTSYPPEYTAGIGKDGMEKLTGFLDAGGIIVSWGRSTKLFNGLQSIPHGKESEEFQLPFSDVSESLNKAGLFCAGSLLRVSLQNDHWLTHGLPSELGIFFTGDAIFRTSIPQFDMDRRVIASFPERDILMSGYIEHEEKLANQSAMIWLKKGKGQLALFAFNPQFRASTQGTYKLLFNALLLPKL